MKITVRKIQNAFLGLGTKDNFNPNDGQTCEYTTDDGQNCIAAKVLLRLGLPVPGPDSGNRSYDHSSWNGANVKALFGVNRFGATAGTDEVWEPFADVEITKRALDILDTVQGEADSGHSWGDAISRVKGARR